MQQSFILSGICGATYFLLVKRKFDLFSVAYFSACIYFLPGFFGDTSYPTLGGWQETPVSDEAYAIMLVVLVAIVCGAAVNDLFTRRRFISILPANKGHHLRILFILASFALLAMLLTTGSALFDSDKQSMLDSMNRFYILFEITIILGTTLAFMIKKWCYFSLFCFFVSFDLYIGNRTSLAITFISTLVLWFSAKPASRFLISYWKQGFISLMPISFLLLYKQLAFAIKIGDLDLFNSLLTNSKTYELMLMHSEPFATQSILNEVTLQNYSLNGEHLKGLIYQFVLFAPQLGLEVKSFNDMFQSDLFPEIDYGLANNIWAEMWSVGRWPLLTVFVLLFILIIFIFNRYVCAGSALFRSTIAVMGSYWVFYIHRNDIGYQLNLEKRVLIIAALTVILSLLIKRLFLQSTKATCRLSRMELRNET